MARPYIDLTGQKFSRLFVIELYGRRGKDNRIVWRVRCDCGTIKLVFGQNLRAKGHRRIQSCGCLRQRIKLETDNEPTLADIRR